MNARPLMGLGGGSSCGDLPVKCESFGGMCCTRHPLLDGHAVSRFSDFIIYSVGAEFIDRVVAQFGPFSTPKLQRPNWM
ncbi:hypothetical protein BD779DRAFT_1557582 [Infundibulicybe gibba]|nr:hypothetical protein BD779DRAFT_1557582 [Infundibulicybe gibba]